MNAYPSSALPRRVDTAFSVLALRERYVLKWLLGLGINPIPPQQVARALKISVTEVHHLRDQALRSLRNGGFKGMH